MSESAPWTKAEIDTVRRLRDQGKTCREIGEVLGRSRDSIRNRIRILPADKSGANKRIKELEELIDHQQLVIETKRAPKFVAKKFKQSSKGDFCRLVVPDTHGCKASNEALAAFLSDAKALDPAEIVLLGDHLDCGGFLAQHHTMGYVAETSYSFEDDVAACNAFLDALQEACPNAVIHYLEGNHERRIEKWCVTEALANQRDADYLRRLFSVGSVLNLEERGIHWYPQGSFHDGLQLPATIKLGKCHFTHGSRTGPSAAVSMLGDFGANVVFGHIHRMLSYSRRTVSEGEIAAWCPGCLCELQPLWNHTQITGWSHGYGVQFVLGGEEFLHINVPIIKGRSYLVPLTRKVSA